MDNSKEALEHQLKYFLGILGIIVLLGVIMVYSSSYIYAKELFGSSAHYFYRQLIYIVVSVAMAFTLWKTKVSFWFKYGWFFHGVVIGLLGLTHTQSYSNAAKGASRWLALSGFTFQPGELIKYTLVLVACQFFHEFSSYNRDKRITYALMFLVPAGLLLAQPDFGTFSICALILGIACFYSDFPRKYMYSAIITGILVIIPILISKPYRVRRLFSYLDPWKNPQTSGFQIIQSYLAFAHGSLFGQGLGNSNEKLFYLPEAHNDFIFSVIGEELGFFGVALVVALFIAFLFLGFKIALQMSEKKSFLLVASLVTTLGVQITFNMGVVLGLLPTKGLNLPFISSGGSSMLANFFCIGLILSAVRAEILKRERESFFMDPPSYHHEELHQTPSFDSSIGSSSPAQGNFNF
jgi:cell division protein FtsW